MSAAETIPTQRIALVLQYLGTHFHGWQRQPHQRTVQEDLETVMFRHFQRHVGVYAAGRTDAGVHAAGQVAHFDASGSIPPSKWAAVLNNALPKDIVVLGSAAVDFHWHARFSALWRRYRYTIYTDRQPNLFVRPFAWHYYYAPLDSSLIQAALNQLLGRRHLAAFHRAGSQRQHSWVEVQAARCDRIGPFLQIEVQANGFLYGMMRLLVGMLVQVGRGERTLENFEQIWTNESREQVKYAAPAHGLCLLRVGYPESPFPAAVWWHDTMPQFLLNPLAEVDCPGVEEVQPSTANQE